MNFAAPKIHRLGGGWIPRLERGRTKTKGGAKFIARVLREQAGLWVKDRNSAARRVKFWRNLAQSSAG